MRAILATLCVMLLVFFVYKETLYSLYFTPASNFFDNAETYGTPQGMHTRLRDPEPKQTKINLLC